MRHLLGVVCIGLILGCLSLAGCQPAGRYGKPQTRPPTSVTPTPTGATETSSKPAPLPAEFAWAEANRLFMEPSMPIEFVHEGTHRAEWNKLPQFWNVVPGPPRTPLPIALLGGSPLVAAGILVAGPVDRVVKIKVPLGLDDPSKNIPTSNPPTLAQWELGKRLFFDKETLLPADARQGKIACATCHDPMNGFTSKWIVPNPPTIINSVYNTSQFWDGRAAALEEVVQRTLEDERETPEAQPEKRHVWPGVIGRLRANKDYVERFQKAFGTGPTQDAVGKALATYMRTVLSGNSVQDQAEQVIKGRGAIAPEAQDYEKVLGAAPAQILEQLLNDDALQGLVDLKEKGAKSELAKHLVIGYTLFYGKAGCAKCHAGRNFTDNRFHNVGERDSAADQPLGKETGRFAVLPSGLKDSRMIGAYKTPTLRALPRTAPYMHDGLQPDLFHAVRVHVRPPRSSRFIDPDIHERNLREEEMRDLVLFLRALDGEAVPSEVADPPK